MSSHHFVKEGQEPALFILEALSFEFVAPLLEWSPLIIVADTIIENIQHWGVKIDVVLQKECTLEQLEHLLQNQVPVKIVACESSTCIAKGLEILVQSNHYAVNLISTPTENLFIELEKSSSLLQIGIHCENQKWSAISSAKFEKWMNEESRLFIRQSTEALLKVNGAVKMGEEWKVLSAGLISIEAASPFWVCELS